MKRFRDAFNGIVIVFKSERNMKIHVVAAITIIGLGFLYKISLTEWSMLSLSIGLVIATEIFNTAIEWVSNFIEPNYNKKIGAIKDASAGAVLIITIASIIIGLIVFIPKIFL